MKFVGFVPCLAWADNYPASLFSLRYLNEGVVINTDEYQIVNIPSIYNEGYSYMGAGTNYWSNLGGHGRGLDYLFKTGHKTRVVSNTDFPGHEYKIIHDLPGHESCAAACDADIVTPCVAWTFDGFSKNAGCYLKSTKASAVAKEGVWSGCSNLFATEDCKPASYTFQDFDMQGDDYTQLNNVADHGACAGICEDQSAHDPPCKAWVFDSGNCWLKRSQPKRTAKQGVWAGCSTKFPSHSCTGSQENLVSPPSGMRSSVPLGPLGEGSVELRADGRLADWGTILNNGPYASDAQWARKIDVDDAAFGILVGTTYARAIRTHPPEGLASVRSLKYSGAFPTAKLSVDDGDDLVAAGIAALSIHAFSEFEMHKPEAQVPAVMFAFTFEALPDAEATDVAVFFNLPDMLAQSNFSGALQSLTLSHSLEELKTGNLSWSLVNCVSGSVDCQAVQFSTAGAESPGDNWMEFVKGGGVMSNEIPTNAAHGAAAARVHMPAGGSVTLTFALSWFFPHRK